jgi:predicted enzyme related to lactoylglutathione lyase
MSSANVGRFVWHELMTTDTKAAIAFYSEIVGWTTQAWEGGEYTMWLSAQGALGGVNALPEAAKKMGAAPHWMSNVEVSDVDAAVGRAKGLGAQILVPPTDMPKIGRFSVISDPQGATLSLYKPAEEMKLHDIEKPGEFCWGELMADDYASAFHFYSEVLGWEKVAEHDMGPMGTYLLFGKGETQYGGMFTKSKDMKMPPAWLYYIEVSKLDQAIEKAKAKGGKLLNGPITVPTGARIAQLLDGQGAAFALHEIARKN